MEKVNTIGWNVKDYVDHLEKAIESKEKEAILEAYDLIEKSDIDFSDAPGFILDEYDELVVKGNAILGY